MRRALLFSLMAVMFFHVSECQDQVPLIQAFPGHDMKCGTEYSTAAKYFRSGDTGMGLPASSTSPSVKTVSSVNSGLARNTLASTLKLRVRFQLLLTSMPFC